MKVGDLVNFFTTAWVFEQAAREYENPGVILEVNDLGRRRSYTVLWANNKITKEHAGYLQGVEK